MYIFPVIYTEEMIRLEEQNQAKKEIEKTEGKKPMKQNMFRVI